MGPRYLAHDTLEIRVIEKQGFLLLTTIKKGMCKVKGHVGTVTYCGRYEGWAGFAILSLWIVVGLPYYERKLTPDR